MFADGVLDEVRQISGKAGATALKALGFEKIGDLLADRITRKECIDTIQSATRQYAKRQLTWFRHQSNFKSLNLSSLDHAEAVDGVTRRVLSLS
jgi:tRNA dimethylallyltransferase